MWRRITPSGEISFLLLTLGLLAFALSTRPLNWLDGVAFAVTIALTSFLTYRRYTRNQRMPRAVAAQGVAVGALAAQECFYATGTGDSTATFTAGMVFIAAVMAVWRIDRKA